MKKKNVKSFTLVEILIAVVIIGAMAGFALMKYSRAIECTRVGDAKNQLGSIHTANRIYFAKTNNYWPQSSSSQDLTAINSNLGLAIISNGLTYSCDGNGSAYSCSAQKAGGSYLITVTQANLDNIYNPICTGQCPPCGGVAPAP